MLALVTELPLPAKQLQVMCAPAAMNIFPQNRSQTFSDRAALASAGLARRGVHLTSSHVISAESFYPQKASLDAPSTATIGIASNVLRKGAHQIPWLASVWATWMLSVLIAVLFYFRAKDQRFVAVAANITLTLRSTTQFPVMLS